MASTYSPSLKLDLIGNGDQSGTWGDTTNNNLGTLLEQAITGVQSIVMVNANYTLTNLNGTSDEARNAVLVVTGTNSAVRDIIAPLVNKQYLVVNNTTGGYAINIRGSSGYSVSIPNGGRIPVYCDGVNFYGGLTGTTGNWAVPGTCSATTFSGAGTGLTGTAAGLTGMSTMGAMGAGANYARQATNPYAVGAYMNPYIQQSLAPQLALLNQQQELGARQIAGQAAGQGAFGGNRATLAQGLNAQNYALAQQQAVGQGYPPDQQPHGVGLRHPAHDWQDDP